MITFAVPLPAPLILVLFGFFGTSGILSYTALTLGFPKNLSGRITTSINMMVFVAAFLCSMGHWRHHQLLGNHSLWQL